MYTEESITCLSNKDLKPFCLRHIGIDEQVCYLRSVILSLIKRVIDLHAFHIYLHFRLRNLLAGEHSSSLHGLLQSKILSHVVSRLLIKFVHHCQTFAVMKTIS